MLLAPATMAPPSGPPTFAAVVAAQFQVGEPSVLVGPGTTPTVWTVSPSGGVFRSNNGGAAWSAADQSVDTDGDASLARDLDGVLYLSGLLSSTATLASTVPVAVSLDGGATFVRNRELVPDAAGVECDRQWTAARGHGESVTSVRCGRDGLVWRTTDAGVTYSGPFTIATDVLQMGPLAYSPDGNLYAAYFSFDDVRVARSADGGLTWQDFHVADVSDSRSFAVVGTDDAGNVYLAYETSGTLFGTGWPAPPTISRVFVSASTNDGATWSAPKQVSDNRYAAIFPWVVGGAAGKVAVAYYVERFVPGTSAANGVGSADLGTPLTLWDVEIAMSVNALAASPTYERTVVEASFHRGSICTSGLACAGPQNLGFGGVPTPFDRRLLDFFEARIDDDGRLYVAYARDRWFPDTFDPFDVILSEVDTVVARQTGGTRLR